MGKLKIIGIGPGSTEELSKRAEKALASSDVIVGYRTYTDLLKDKFPDKEFISSSMRDEVARAEEAIRLAEEGKELALISSGDPGVYGMAGIVLEILAKKNKKTDLEIIPGISAVSSAASLLGAPIMNDFSVISLSDLLTPHELILKRVKAAAEGDFVIAIYNPKSRERLENISEVQEILLNYRSPETPVGIVTNAMREGQSVIITDLENMCNQDINMASIVIIGNSTSFLSEGKIITPRGYEL